VKRLYEKPKMVTEKIEPQKLVASVSGPLSPERMDAFLGICAN
jgi:hypothetical protein